MVKLKNSGFFERYVHLKLNKKSIRARKIDGSIFFVLLCYIQDAYNFKKDIFYKYQYQILKITVKAKKYNRRNVKYEFILVISNRMHRRVGCTAQV